MITRGEPRVPPGCRRGSVYILVLMVSITVVAIGLSGLAATRVRARTVAMEQDWHTAGILAQSAVDHALLGIASDRWWRLTHEPYENQFTPETVIGAGLVSWKFDDLVDTNLDDDPAHPIRLHARARVGEATRVYSVIAWPDGESLDVLRTAIHASGEFDVRAVLDARGGPASSNAGFLVNNGYLIGDAEAGSVDTPGNVTGSVTVPAPAKTMPSAALWDVYKNFATVINYNDVLNHSGDMRHAVISPASNPYKPAQTNPDGLYYIKVPGWTTLDIWRCRIEGTLLVELQQDSAKVNIGPDIVWNPHRPDYPALIVYTKKDSGNTVTIDCSGELSEFLTGVNYNPSHTPYFGSSDADTSDTYAASMRGLVHVIRDVLLPPVSRTDISATRRITGCIVADGDVQVTANSIIVNDPTLRSRPPLGYTTARDPANLLTNGDMEQGLTAWSPEGGSTVLVSEGSPHSGAKRITVKSRSSASHGIAQDVTSRIANGVPYVSDLWLMMRDSPEGARITLEVDSTGDGTARFEVTVPDVQKTWTRVTAGLTPTWTGDLNSARWIAATTTTTQEFRIDDALLAPQTLGPPVPTMVTVPGTWRIEAAP